MTIAFPKPDKDILLRRGDIVAGLARLVPGEALIVTEDERRAFETDALTAYRADAAGRRAAVFDRGGVGYPRVLPRERRQGGAARRRDLALPAAPSRRRMRSCSASPR